MDKLEFNKFEELVRIGEIDTVIVAAVDMQGKLFGKRIPAGYFIEEAKNGIHTCSINMIWDVELDIGDNFEFSNWDTGFQDMKAVPDLSTMRLCPWCDKTVLVLADLHNAEGDTILEIAPRNILKKQLEKAKQMGYQSFAASEIEFYIFRETPDSIREKSFANLKPLFGYPDDYSIYRLTVDDWFLSQLVRNLEAAAIPVEALKGEWGMGQIELNLRYSEALEMADRTAIYKNGIKEMAVLNELMATFMARPHTNDSGSSCHTHFSFWDKDGKQNLFWDPEDEYQLSTVGRHFLGGIMALAPEFMIFYAPYINSYKRLKDTAGAPNTLTWGFDNRTVSIRCAGKEGGRRIENRIPGADANLYLVLAAMLASGLYGIEEKIDIPNPYLNNAYADPNVKKLPSNLVEAVSLLEKSELAPKLMGEAVINHYLTAAKNEINRFFSSVTDWERKKYFEFI
ncbi:glutamine synthetase family protein [Metallumcola ferriviriculae]|uniref:Glutamine synthetase family protein n=1 Tax=Metallumcola ferriviriculae TaxID=3039180 RepID=A0AAU0UMH7_9FIRM|nr:glutamine synthetase family protein [Desulfitibacteraceae bacterium MK1]